MTNDYSFFPISMYTHVKGADKIREGTENLCLVYSRLFLFDHSWSMHVVLLLEITMSSEGCYYVMSKKEAFKESEEIAREKHA